MPGCWGAFARSGGSIEIRERVRHQVKSERKLRIAGVPKVTVRSQNSSGSKGQNTDVR